MQRLLIEYNTDLFDASTIQRLLTHFQTLLAAIVGVDRPVSAVQLLSEHEKKHMLAGWNPSAVPYPSEQGVHQLFEDQATRTPQSVAVADDRHILTYRELSERSNRLAHFLASVNVGPGDLVGVHLPRGADLVVALLGVLKAGGRLCPARSGFSIGTAGVHA